MFLSLSRSCLYAISFFLLIGTSLWAQVPSTKPFDGLREHPPTVYAFVGATIVVSPSQTLENATLIIRDGVIVAVGTDVEVPPDATVRDCRGRRIYPGLIDAFSELPPVSDNSSAVATYWNKQVRSQIRVDQYFQVNNELSKKYRSQGITLRLIAPAQGIIKGASALITTASQESSRTLVREQIGMHLRLNPSAGGSGYPNSPMGAMALVRQVFHDADWYRNAWALFHEKTGLPQPEKNESLAALLPCLERKMPVIIDGPDELYFFRAQQIAAEFQLNCIIHGSGNEYRRLEAIRSLNLPVLVPVNFPKAPNVGTPESAQGVTLERLLDWDLAPENPARLHSAGIRMAFCTHGLKDVGEFLGAVRKAVDRGLSPEAALAAMTIVPAELFGVQKNYGTLESGKNAHFFITAGDLFAKDAQVLETWINGDRSEVASVPLLDPRGSWQWQLTRSDGGSELLEVLLEGDTPKTDSPLKPKGKIKRGEKEISFDQLLLDGYQISGSFKGKELGWDGVLRFSLTLTPSAVENLEGSSKIQNSQLVGAAEKAALGRGVLVWADGSSSYLEARLAPSPEVSSPKDPAEAKQANPAASESEQSKDKPSDQKNPEVTIKEEKKQAENEAQKKEDKLVRALFEPNYPLGAFGVTVVPQAPTKVLFHNAVVWTSGSAGILTKASVLVENGKITAVGTDLAVPSDAVVIDASGKHLTPGIIDCHSHIATDGGVNETGQTITAEVRIGDFIDPNDINIYRQLAGGVTTSNILHGSANTIGGQNQVIKFRWGALPEEMKFAAAPPGIKFALGENVKQSNWGEQFSSRYPQTRMGVEQLLRDAFRAAMEYRLAWAQWRDKPQGLPPRVDLEMEALVEVLSGKRLVHCHSYRQDEILALLRACEDYQVRVATLQHILEGYKVADAIAQHGAGGSSFADWWAYKFEVFDAIPYNGALMHQAGVVVSFNSDDPELGRRLNLEAAKAVKYGGISPEDALKFVTINPAKQLGIDSMVGSIEPGKDADLVLWSGSPLSTFSRCEQTWIDGRRYFDLSEDKIRREQTATMHAALVQRVLNSGEPLAENGQNDVKKELWPREDIYCVHTDGTVHLRYRTRRNDQSQLQE